MGEVNDNTNDNTKINRKAEEHQIVVESDSNSKSMDIESENASTDEEVAGSSVRKNRCICKVTDKGDKEAHDDTNEGNILHDPDDLFHDSTKDDLSTGYNMVADKKYIKTGSDNKRKAESDNENTDDGKNKKGGDKE